MKLHTLTMLCFIAIPFSILAQERVAERVALGNLKNLYRFSDSIYRSEQPNNKEFKALEEKGIKTVLNLRRLKDDKKKARGTNLQLKHLPFTTKKLTEANIIDALKTIKNAEKPLLVHCWHGSDRTGVVLAAYRIIFENWTKADAIAEFRRVEFGYHENWYPNLLLILNELDVAHIKNALGIE